MKKIFMLTAIFLLTLCSSASAQQDYNFMHVSDLGAQAFVDKMGNGNIYQTMKQNGNVVAFTAPNHHPELEDPEKFSGLNVFVSVFGIQGSQTPNGQLVFYVDPEGHVFAVRVINEGNPQLSYVVLLMTMEAIGLNDQEAAPLLQTQAQTAETFCAAANRKILRTVADQQGNNVVLIGLAN